MSLAARSSRYARSILFLLLALVAGGVLASRSLPVSLFPHVNFPRIRVNLDAGDRPAERMELDVTRPVELALRGIPGVRGVESTTSRGSAEVSITFDWGQDMTAAYLEAQSQINQILATLPKGATFNVRRMDPTVFPVIAYSLTSASRSPAELNRLARFQLLPALSSIEGVAKVGVDGGDVADVRVTVSPEKLAAHGLALSDVTSALASANVLTAVGHVEEHYKLYLVIADTSLTTLDDVRHVVLKTTPSSALTVGDVAEVERSVVPNFTHSTADGRDCALLNVYQQPGGNTVRIAADVRSTLAELQKHLPTDVTIANWYDQSDLITESAAGVRDAVLIGVALAALVLLLFLRDWRMTLIATLSVPVVLAITSLLLYALGQSFNIMTLGGMAAAVGLIIDDAIVMSEHIVRRLHGATGTANDVGGQVVAATTEFTKPLTGSSLSTIVIHIPPAFLVGVFGAFFAALSLAMAASLIISFFVAWLVIPVLASRLLRGGRHRPAGRIARGVDHAYAHVMRLLLPLSWLAIVVILPLLAAGYLAYTRVPSGVMPSVDEGGFVIDYVGPPGASITEMDRLLGQVEAILKESPEVATYSRRTGFSLGGDISETNTGDFFVRLKPQPRRAIHEVMDEVQAKVEHTVPGLEIEPLQLMEDLLGDLTGRPQPVVVNLFGSDEKALVALAPKVADTLSHVQGLSSIEDGIVPAGDAIQVRVDPTKAAIEGLTPDAVTQSLNEMLSGTVATQLQQNEDTNNLRVELAGVRTRTTDQLAALQLRAPDGHLVPLGRIATFTLLPGQPEITRLDLQRVVSITARSDRDLGSTIRDVRAALDHAGVLPASVRYTLGGQYEEQQAAYRGTIRVVVAASALVLLLLLLLYERVRVAIAILITSMLAIAAVFVGLRVTGTELNISSMMGMVMIVGNVTEVAIFYYSEYGSLGAGDRQQRLIAAGSQRLRAITMTTLAAILALLPLALDLGHSAGMLRPLAIAIITGLAVQLPLILLLLPMLLTLFRLDAPGRTTQPTSPSSDRAFA